MCVRKIEDGYEFSFEHTEFEPCLRHPGETFSRKMCIHIAMRPIGELVGLKI